MTSVLGADGCRGGGWVVAEVPLQGTGLAWHHCEDTAALLRLRDQLGATRILLDVPIGLPEEGRRAADEQARVALRGGTASSVFAAPHRAVLAHSTYPQARTASRSLSAQSFALVSRIRDVDEALRAAGPSVHDIVAECHPEVSFRALTQRVLGSKKTAAGALARLTALEEVFGTLPRDAPTPAALDDALDAAVCAWSALRWARGSAEVLGGDVDATGVPMRIVV